MFKFLGALAGALLGDAVDAALDRKVKRFEMQFKIGHGVDMVTLGAAVRDLKEKQPMNRAAVEKILWFHGLRLDGEIIKPAVQLSSDFDGAKFENPDQKA